MKTFLKTFACLFCLGAAVHAQAQTPLAEKSPQERDYTDLMMSIARDDAAQVAFLLREKRLDPNFYLPNGETPMVWAIKNDAWITAEKVLIKSVRLNIDMPTIRGETPLMLAAIKGRQNLAQTLLDMGADINANYGWTALHYSASTGQSDMTRFLIEKGAKVNARTERGVTPLYMAARIVSTPTVNVLLQAGADKTMCNDQGISPSAIAKKRGDNQLAERLAIDKCSPWPVAAQEATQQSTLPAPENAQTTQSTEVHLQ